MKTAIITGASKGIGKACAYALANEYNYMAICSRDSNNTLDLTALDITRNRACTCEAYKGDVSDYSFVKNMIESVVKKTGGIDLLVNNAGISWVGLFQDMTPDEWNHILSTNLSSVYNTCNLVLPHMLEKKNGKIINVSSVWGSAGASCEVAYCATKGAINSFTKALAKELAPSNIPVNAIAFGAIDTDMNSHLTEEEMVLLADEIPFGRLAKPEEAGDFIRQIANMPAYFTGEIVKFDGGWI